jgi:hypothetical protein
VGQRPFAWTFRALVGHAAYVPTGSTDTTLLRWQGNLGAAAKRLEPATLRRDRPPFRLVSLVQHGRCLAGERAANCSGRCWGNRPVGSGNHYSSRIQAQRSAEIAPRRSPVRVPASSATERPAKAGLSLSLERTKSTKTPGLRCATAQLVREIAATGHELTLHGPQHQTPRSSRRLLANDTRRAPDALSDAAGTWPRLYRPHAESSA